MQLRHYAVTVMDNWTPMRTFWTLRGADRFYWKHRPGSHLFKWNGQEWRKLTYTIVEGGMRKVGL